MAVNFLANGMMPAICTPLTGRTISEVQEQLQVVCTQAPDVIEWRADYFLYLADTDVVVGLIEEIKAVTDIPLLFTIRAEHEGGEQITLSEHEKVDLLKRVCKETDVDVIDYETSNLIENVQILRAISKENNKELILSYHNFESTPSNEQLLERALAAEELGADVAKFAVMPKNKADVFRLLEVTRMLDDVLKIPVVTMSMGELGGLSRVIGWAYGSVLTFGVGVEVSAPGQMPAKQLRKAIQNVQGLLPKWD